VRLDRPRTRAFGDLLATARADAATPRTRAVGPDTIAKFLFTSGSTKQPKA
jgi:feruloyl-CoA synthase